VRRGATDWHTKPTNALRSFCGGRSCRSVDRVRNPPIAEHRERYVRPAHDSATPR